MKKLLASATLIMILTLPSPAAKPTGPSRKVKKFLGTRAVAILA